MLDMLFKSVFDKGGLETKMAGRQPSSGVFRPVHHSEVITIRAALTRPANTTPYAVGDALGSAASAVFEFDLDAAGIGAGLIVSARLIRSSVNNTSVRFRGFIHDAAPAAVPAADNDPAVISFANSATRRGWVDFANPIVGSDCADYAGVLSNPQGVVVSPAAGDSKARLILTTLDGFAPDASTQSVVELGMVV